VFFSSSRISDEHSLSLNGEECDEAFARRRVDGRGSFE